MDAAYSWLQRSVSKLKKTSLPSSDDDETIYGITDQLIEFVNSFSLETFNSFSLPDEEEFSGNSGNLRRDLSDWQQAHAMLALSRIKVLAQLRFQLCPRYLKERQFWKIYFTLVWSYVAEYELKAVKLAKLKQMRNGDDETISNSNSCEVEMSEVNFNMSTESATNMKQM